MTVQTNAILKQAGKYFNVYLMNVPVYFATVHKPKKKFESNDEEYAVTAFVDSATREKLESEFQLNKEMFEVGRDKNKKKQVKFKLSSQLKENEKVHYDDVAGMHGISLSVDVVDKNGHIHKVNVIDQQGQPFTEDIGNLSVCNIKLFAYRNKENMLIVKLDTVQIVDHVPYEGGNNNGVVNDDILGVSYTAAPIEKVDNTPTPPPSHTTEQIPSNAQPAGMPDEWDDDMVPF